VQEGKEPFISGLPETVAARHPCTRALLCNSIVKHDSRHWHRETAHKLDSHLGFISAKQKGKVPGKPFVGSGRMYITHSVER
jgi:hypothetical protein